MSKERNDALEEAARIADAHWPEAGHVHADGSVSCAMSISIQIRRLKRDTVSPAPLMTAAEFNALAGRTIKIADGLNENPVQLMRAAYGRVLSENERLTKQYDDLMWHHERLAAHDKEMADAAEALRRETKEAE